MKKIIIAMVFIIPLFLGNNVNAQNGSQGGDPPYFYVNVHVDAPSYCPTTGIVDGYVPVLGHTNTDYTGTTTYGSPYVLLWSNNYPGTQPCTVEVTTDQNSQGHYCHAKKTETLAGSSYGYIFNLQLEMIGEGGGGGNEQ